MRSLKGFTDPVRLLAECEKRKPEGVVEKRIDAPTAPAIAPTGSR